MPRTTAQHVIEKAASSGIKLATAESCTGGLIIGALTDIAGSSQVVDRGFITYSNAAKQEMLGVTKASLEKFGAVSRAVAGEMAYGALSNSMADITVSVTGIAGPGGGSDDKPVGLVWFGVAEMGQAPHAEKMIFKDQGRDYIRQQTVDHALKLILDRL